MNQTESFGVRLAQLRRDAGLSQQELAQTLSPGEDGLHILSALKTYDS